jgi:hypothetical protein
MDKVSLKDYFDALAAENRRTANMRVAAIVGTFGALIFGIFKATGVLAAEFKTRMDTTNEWRGALDDQSKNKVTTQEFSQLKEMIEEVKAEVAAARNLRTGAAGNWKMIGAVIAAVAAINGIIFVIQHAM